MIEILYRNAEADGGPWSPVARVEDAAGVADELASWMGPSLSHGDLVRVVDGRQENLFVFDGARSAFALVMPPADWKSIVWTRIWEDNDPEPEVMLSLCENVDQRRVVLAAYEIVNGVDQFLPASEKVLRDALKAVRSWTLGEIDQDAISRHAEASYDALYGNYEGVALYARAASAIYNLVCAAEDYLRQESGCWTYASMSVQDATSSRLSRASKDNEVRKKLLKGFDEIGCASVRKYIPLSVLACARVDISEPLPMPRRTSAAPSSR